MSDNQDNNYISSLTTFEELQAYANAQYKLVIELSKKIQTLEEEKKHLEGLMKEQSFMVNINEINQLQGTPNEEAICMQQLSLLKQTSLDRELTMEEAKKVEIYTKILIQLNNRKPVENPKEKFLSDAELLQLVKNTQ